MFIIAHHCIGMIISVNATKSAFQRHYKGRKEVKLLGALLFLKTAETPVLNSWVRPLSLSQVVDVALCCRGSGSIQLASVP